MTCKPCQFALNLGLALDHLANTLLLGDPNETLSRRVGRARDAGHKWASAVCRVLSQLFGRDHCGFAESPGTTARELWAWSPWLGEPDIDGDGV